MIEENHRILGPITPETTIHFISEYQIRLVVIVP